MGGEGGSDPGAWLARALEPALGAPVQVSGMAPLTSGASRRSWRFDAAGPSGAPRRFVVQQEMSPRVDEAAGAFAPLSMAAQGGLITAAAGAGVPVAPVVASGEHDGCQYLVAEWRDGEALPPRLLRDPDLAGAVAKLAGDCARALAGIHSLEPGGLGLPATDRIALFRGRLDQTGEKRAVLELGHRWLVTHRPPAEPAVVVHGDFRLGNLLVGPGGLAAVLDWEMAHLGDRHEDIAWATIRAWRFDRHRPAGAFPDEASWVAAYDRAAGPERGVDPERLRWWQIAGTWTWAVISAMQARRHLDGWVQSLEHAVIGRRVCESEWDLLELLP